MKTPTNYSILYYRVKVGKVDWLQCVSTNSMIHWSNCTTCPHLTLESFDWCKSSRLGGYQFVDQRILYLPSLLYIFYYIQHSMHIGLNYLSQNLLFSFYVNWALAVCSKLLIHMRELNLPMSLKFLLEVMTTSVISKYNGFW